MIRPLNCLRLSCVSIPPSDRRQENSTSPFDFDAIDFLLSLRTLQCILFGFTFSLRVFKTRCLIALEGNILSKQSVSCYLYSSSREKSDTTLRRLPIVFDCIVHNLSVFFSNRRSRSCQKSRSFTMRMTNCRLYQLWRAQKRGSSVMRRFVLSKSIFSGILGNLRKLLLNERINNNHDKHLCSISPKET